MRILLAGVAAVGLTLVTPAVAQASPGPADLAGLDAVDSSSFYTYATYGAGGWQFTTAGGVRCRIITVNRWSGPPRVDCWGALPGVADVQNHAFATYTYTDGIVAPTAAFEEADLASFETYRSYDHRSGDDVDQVDPASYHLLSEGSKLVADPNVTCGVVAEDQIVCTIGGTTPVGFVLSPRGSSTF